MWIVALGAAYLMFALAIAVVARGPDMDQLTSRNAASRAAAPIHDLLWEPHDRALRAVPNAWLIRNKWIIPVALVANSLAWGGLLYLLGRLAKIRRRR